MESPTRKHGSRVHTTGLVELTLQAMRYTRHTFSMQYESTAAVGQGVEISYVTKISNSAGSTLGVLAVNAASRTINSVLNKYKSR